MEKKNRLLEIFYRAMKGENLCIKELALEYNVSKKSISRDLGEIKLFLSESRDVVGNGELEYSAATKTYHLEFEEFLLSKELMAIIKILIGSRGLEKTELLEIIGKLKKFTSYQERATINKLIDKEIYRYQEVNHDCGSVIDNVWKLTRCIDKQIEISVLYYKMNRELVERRIKPIAIIFSEYYFYLIAYRSNEEPQEPAYFQVDRIVDVVEHRVKFEPDRKYCFDEGELRNKIQFMFPGKNQKIKFEFSGPSVQAILDKIPTAKVVEVRGEAKVIEAETYGTGIKMYLMSQGSWVKVLEPPELVEEMKAEIENMKKLYK